jgi:hypothetical protein
MKFTLHHCLTAPILLLLGTGILPAQSARVSVDWKISTTCGEMIPSSTLQQNLADQLRAASITVSRVQASSLIASIDCQTVGASRVSTMQCLSLMQAVSEPSAANGLHLTTTWRNCQSYKCGKQNCDQTAGAAQRTLVEQFIPAFRTLTAKSETPTPQPAAEVSPEEASLAPVVSGSPKQQALRPVVVFYAAYILLCIAVLARWAVVQTARV